MVVESGAAPMCRETVESLATHYTFIPDTGPFPKTRLVNQAACKSNRDIIAMHDADVLFKPQAIQALVTAFRQNRNCHYGLPYNGVFLDVNEPTKSRLTDSWDFGCIPQVAAGVLYREYAPGVICVNPVSVGGANYFRRETFLKLGGFNEKFVSCIWEDYEIEARFTKMGFPAAIIGDANAYHLHHTRVSDEETQRYNLINRKEYEKVCGMDQKTLERYIQEELLPNLQKSQERIPK